MKLSTMKLTIGFFFGLVLALPVVGHAFLYTPDDYSDGHDRGTCGLNGPCGYPGDPFVFINLTRTFNPDPIPTYEPPQAPAGTCNGASNGETAGGRQYLNITGSNLTSVNKDNLNVTCNGVPVPASALMFGTQTNDFVQVSFPQPTASGSCTATPQGQASCQPVAITGTAPTPPPAPAPTPAPTFNVSNVATCANGGTPPACAPPAPPAGLRPVVNMQYTLGYNPSCGPGKIYLPGPRGFQGSCQVMLQGAIGNPSSSAAAAVSAATAVFSKIPWSQIQAMAAKGASNRLFMNTIDEMAPDLSTYVRNSWGILQSDWSTVQRLAQAIWTASK